MFCIHKHLQIFLIVVVIVIIISGVYALLGSGPSSLMGNECREECLIFDENVTEVRRGGDLCICETRIIDLSGDLPLVSKLPED